MTTELLNGAKHAYEAGDYSKAFRLYAELAQSGNTASQVELSKMLIYGVGVKKDLQAAKKWALCASEAESSEAWFFLAEVYELLGDKSEALSCYLKSSDLGNSSASYRLASPWRRGLPYNDFHETQKKWATKAAQQGHAYGLVKLSFLTWKGICPGGKLAATRLMTRALKIMWHKTKGLRSFRNFEQPIELRK